MDEAGVPVGARDADATDVWAVTPPTFRPDLIREVDLIEEVGRIAGYGMAPETLPRHTTAGGLTKPQQVRRAVRRALAGCGLDEVITYSFIAPDALAPLGLPEGDVRLDPVRLSNPMSVEQSVHAHHAAARACSRPCATTSTGSTTRRTCSRSARSTCGTSRCPAPAHAAEPGAVLPHEPEAVGIVLSGPLRGRELDRRRPPDRLLHAQGRASTRCSRPSACAASTGRSATWPGTSRTCTPASRRS